jgi:hypothetical protein
MPKPVGMYGETPSVKIGPFTVSRQYEENTDDPELMGIWIKHEDGEGGQFDEAALAAHIQTFWDANF